MARALENGEAGLQVVDQNQRLRGVFAPFFGKIASCERAAMSLALRRGYPVIVAAVIRRGYSFEFELVVGETFYPEVTGDKAAKAALIEEICALSKGAVVQTIGHVLLLYRAAKKQDPKLSNVIRFQP